MVSKSTIKSDVYNLIYDRLNSSISIITSDGKTHAVQSVTSSFQDRITDESSDYPVIEIEEPTFDEDGFTFGKMQINGQITIVAYATKKEAVSKLMDYIHNHIETYKATFADNGMTFVKASNETYDFVERGKIKVHFIAKTYSFKYKYARTQSW